MLSSTSSSEVEVRRSRTTASPFILLLAALVILLAGFEALTRTVIERRSKVQNMINREYREAVQIRRPGLPGSSGLKQLLVVGNSLVGHGIDLDELKQGLPPQWQAHRFWIYNTSYTDWHFGLRRLFAEGSMPNVVALVFVAMNWYADGTRGDYSSQYLFQTGDLLKVSSEAHLDRTETASLFFARYSKFYALRSDIRKVLLNALMPDLPRMYAVIKPGSARHFTDDALIPLITRRIATCRSIVELYGSKLILIVPPLPDPAQEYHRAIWTAADNAGVTVIMPMSSSDVPPANFLDDVHLTPQGAKVFTSQVSKALSPILQ